MTESMSESLLQSQIDYYRARAPEYDEWVRREGRYDYGVDQRARWLAEVAQVQAALDHFGPRGNVLELACGTGWWTEHLARHTPTITAVDASLETIALNRQRLQDPRVRYMHADIFQWQPDERYDVVFFSFWLSHVPADRFVAFWELVRSALSPGGRVFFIDSLYARDSSAHDHTDRTPQTTVEQRRLNDGRVYEIVKVYHEPAALAGRLRELGWDVHVDATPTYFLYGGGSRR